AGGETPSGAEQVVDPARHERAVRDRVPGARLEEAPERLAARDVLLDRPRRAADAVGEAAAAEHVVLGELDLADDLARLADAEPEGAVGDEGVGEAGHRAPPAGGEHRALAAAGDVR